MDETYQVVRRADLTRVVEALRLYMEQDECVCDALPDLPLFQAAKETCPPDCDRCMWCIGRKALRGVGQRADAEKQAQ